MKINLTKKQYRELITLISISNGILGVLGDVMTETDYKKRSKESEELENYFLQYAADFGCDGLAEKYNDQDVLDEEFYENEIYPIIKDYEEYATHDTLSNKLAWRDFRRDHTKEELKKMSKKNGGYFGVEIFDYEKKYWDEFENNGFDRLFVEEDGKKVGMV